MENEFCFLFYPGEYLRDTQVLSERAQVAYDRIICEHMRNICITQQRVNFLTKRLTPDEIEEVMSVLKPIEGGFQIAWVAASINKRRAFSESRSKNRAGKSKKDMNNISQSYDEHMVKEIVIENVNKSKDSNGKGVQGRNTDKTLIFPYDSEKFIQTWKVLSGMKKWKKKEFAALQASLKKLSEHSEDDAIKMMENAIAGEWQGIFELEKHRNGQSNNQNGAKRSIVAAAEEVLRRASGEDIQ